MTPTGTNYFAFMCWIGLWSLVMHWILALTNACNALRYVTRFPCDIFGFYVAFIYLQKGIQILTRQGSGEEFYLSVMVSLLVLGFGYLCGIVGDSPLFQHYIRLFVKDYGTPLTVIFFTGFCYFGKMASVDLNVLPVSKAFFPTVDRSWFIHFWDIRLGDVFIAIPFAILLTILFYFDHNGRSFLRPSIILSLPNFYSVLPDRSGNRIPSSQASRLSLGHLSPRSYNRRRRTPRHSLPQRSDPSSTLPYELPVRD